MVHKYTRKTFLKSPIATFSQLPLGNFVGEMRLVIDENALYQWDGSQWINAGLAGTGTFRADGSVPVKGDWNIAGYKLLNLGQLTSEDDEGFDLLSDVLDGASAEAFSVDTVNAITDAGARLLTLKIQGVEKFGIDKDGDIVVGGGLSSTGNVNVFLDTDNDDPDEAFTIYHNTDVPTVGLRLFQVRADGEVEIFGGPLIGGTSPFELRSKEADGGSAIGFKFNTDNALTTNGSKVFSIQNNSNEILTVRQGNDLLGGVFTAENILELTNKGGTDTVQMTMTDDPLFLLVGYDSTPMKWWSIDTAGTKLMHMDLNASDFIVGADDYAGNQTISGQLQSWNAISNEAAVIHTGLTAGTDPEIKLRAFDGTANNAYVNSRLVSGNPESFMDSSTATESTKVEAKFDGYGNPLIRLEALDGGKIHTLDIFDDQFDLKIDSDTKLRIDDTEVKIADRLTSIAAETLSLFSTETDGSSAVAFELDTANDLADDDAKLVSVKNDGDEVWYIRADGSTPSGFVRIVRPSEGDAGITTAINEVDAAGGGIVQLLEGTYVIDAGIIPNAEINNVTLRGVGAGTILEHDGIYTGRVIDFTGTQIQNSNISNVTLGDNSITYTTVAEAGNVLEGDRLWIQGTDVGAETDYEANIAAADGNPGTGVVTLKHPIQRTLTTVTSRNLRGGDNLKVESLRLTSSSPLVGALGIYFESTANGIIRDVLIDNWDGGTSGAIRLDEYGINNLVENCRMSEGINGHIVLQTQIGSFIFDNVLIDLLRTPATDLGSVTISNTCVECEISRNIIKISGSFGVETKGTASRRIVISENTINNTTQAGILSRYESTIENNVVENMAGVASGIDVQFGNRNVIKGNFIKRCYIGINTWDTSYNLVIADNLIDTTTSIGIYLAAKDSVITGNILTSIGNDGISQYDGDGGNIISNNRIDGAARGIRISSGDNNVVSGNLMNNLSSTGLTSSTDNNIFTCNNYDGEGSSITGTGNIFSLNKE